MGIGMVEKLHVVPLWFVATASIVILACLYQRHVRSLVSIAFLVILSATMILVEKSRTPEESDTIARGKQVYIAEGCIHCHSQYLRPGSQDERYWGDAKRKAEVLAASPVMIGNRRQGPDLTHVSGRRSDAWLREHFIAPRLFAPDSAMPSYAHLFQDRRGDDLIAFLTRDRATALPMMQQRWQQSPALPEGPSDLATGQKLFARHCSACHGINGDGDGPLANKLSMPVANLANGPYRWTQTTVPRDPSLIDRVIRHGIPGTDMPGHETFSDEQVRSLRQWVIELYKKPESF